MTALIVDDSEADAVVLKLELERLFPNAEITAVKNLDRARKALISKPYEWVFLDINLRGDEDGIFFLNEVRNSYLLKNQKVVVLSGSPRDIDKLTAESLKADAYIEKQVGLEPLREKLLELFTKETSKKAT